MSVAFPQFSTVEHLQCSTLNKADCMRIRSICNPQRDRLKYKTNTTRYPDLATYMPKTLLFSFYQDFLSFCP